MASAKFYGRGLAFPFRIDPAKGGATVTEGNTNEASVALEFLQDSWSIRETVYTLPNHIAEAVSHILLTSKGEHDTLPEFGSYLFVVLFEPNTFEFKGQAEVYFTTSTKRWEKRMYVDPERGVTWIDNDLAVDRGERPISVQIDFILSQVPSNLVAPFVTVREARLQEYPSTSVDDGGHDWVSRYKNYTVYNDGDECYIRTPRLLPIPYANDDIFYKVKVGDTWLLIADEVYKDIRFEWIVSQMYVNSIAEDGASRELLSTVGDPPENETLRLPSKARVLATMI